MFWVVRSHHIEYRIPILEGDEIQLMTWVGSVERVSSVRRYEFRRTRDDALMASGERLNKSILSIVLKVDVSSALLAFFTPSINGE